ncbi:benzoylsuccinyl-CoA thiolase [Streptomyces sp. SID13666]|uniref:Zn-ribbon domain-containing OB-fold protein n=1 Tax=Streptomyces TaxID=1883 RepID=UPI001105E4E7|nr:benzoylsuccinyl-CoA thiolase [Streptomyces sp. SID13666]NEA76813.1 benzoylsuccinyl-CoA thiolase [Streptomyces sp. SID13588]QNA71898.1 benzoylsuccinyl-CoA thiolase [Streptomyces sp. So13.3]
MARARKPVVAGWFTEAGPHTDDGPAAQGTGADQDFRLIGTRCQDCGSVFFPREDTFCRNPACSGTTLEETPLSRRGRVWSYTDGRYRPPAPYVSDPAREWEPYVLVAVELAAERMVVLGQAAPGTALADLAVGMEVELVPGVLNEDDETTWTTWHWQPLGGDR